MTELPLGDAIARQIRKYRLRKGWSVRRLAEECERLGMPGLTEASLGNIERGQRQDAKRTQRRVLVEELAVLAQALDVPPILLTLPLGASPSVRVTPDLELPTWTAVHWWAGEEVQEFRPGVPHHVAVTDPVLQFHRDHEEQVHAAQSWPTHDPASLRRLRDLREHMRRAEILRPELPADLAAALKDLPDD